MQRFLRRNRAKNECRKEPNRSGPKTELVRAMNILIWMSSGRHTRQKFFSPVYSSSVSRDMSPPLPTLPISISSMCLFLMWLYASLCLFYVLLSERVFVCQCRAVFCLCVFLLRLFADVYVLPVHKWNRPRIIIQFE